MRALCSGGGAWGAQELSLEAYPEPAEGKKLALEMLGQALGLGHLGAGRVAGDDAFGMSPSFRDALATLGMRYVLEVPGGTPVLPLESAWSSLEYHPEYQGPGRPCKPQLRDGQRRTLGQREQRSDELPDKAWREITVAQAVPGPRTCRFSGQRVRVTRKGKPGEEIWALYRRNLDGSEPSSPSNAPGDTPLETLARVGGSRW